MQPSAQTAQDGSVMGRETTLATYVIQTLQSDLANPRHEPPIAEAGAGGHGKNVQSWLSFDRRHRAPHK